MDSNRYVAIAVSAGTLIDAYMYVHIHTHTPLRMQRLKKYGLH